MKRLLLGMGMVAALSSRAAAATWDTRDAQAFLDDNNRASGTVMHDAIANSDTGRRGNNVGVTDTRLAGKNVQLQVDGAVATQVSVVLPQRTRKVRIQLTYTVAGGVDPTTTNYLRWSIVTSSIFNGDARLSAQNTEEAYQNFEKIFWSAANPQPGTVSLNDLDPDTQYTINFANPKAGNGGLALLIETFGKRPVSLTYTESGGATSF